jgi:tRNA-splicing ligase RtcB
VSESQPSNIFGTHDEKTLMQLRDVATRAERVALMADGHSGYVMPIGGVAGYRNQVSVVGVGFDIACGNAAILTDRTIDEYSRSELEELATEIQQTISFGVGLSNRSSDAPHDSALFEDSAWKALAPNVEETLRQRAREQLGTVGAGNHYVDVFSDEQGRIWVGVHFGSRGFGHTVASGFLALSQNQKWGTRVPEKETLLDLSSPLGDAYWALMNLGGKYAYAGREWVARKVASMLGGKELDLVHNHHNFAWREKHGGEELVVVRKGATPAFPGQRGFVGGSMGDDAVILEGTANAPDVSEAALWSTVHGAGRVMSRTEARGKLKGWGPKARIVAPGKVSWQMVNEWLGPKGVILRGGGLDEAPHAYRRLPDVIAAQGSTVRVVHTLTPVIVVMAGQNEYDPYKD